MIIHLDIRTVARKALEAYEAGTLSAQAPMPVCAYRTVQDGKTYACAIGCALTDEQYDSLLAQSGLGEDQFNESTILNLKDLLTWSPALSQLQVAHDDWVRSLAQRPGMISVADIEFDRERFLTLARRYAGETDAAL